MFTIGPLGVTEFEYYYRLKRKKSTYRIFHDINSIGKLIPAYSRFLLMQECILENGKPIKREKSFRRSIPAGFKWFL